MKKNLLNLLMLGVVLAVIVLSLLGPEMLAKYRDKKILERQNTEQSDQEAEGYRYALSSNEKLYILSECLSSQTLPEMEQSTEAGIQELSGTYAFIINHRGPSEKEITNERLYQVCNEELNALKELNILPAEIRALDESEYEAVLYSAIDVLEPRNNVAIWKVSLSNSHQTVRRQNAVMDLYLDAQTGKIYEFYARSELEWSDLDPDSISAQWADYLELEGAISKEAYNPLMEITPYFEKYSFDGIGEGKTTVTIGFFEGINEIFLRISK